MGAPSLLWLTRRRFATPRSATLVLVALTALAAFAIAAAPRALVGVIRAEIAHQITAVPTIARDLTARTVDVPLFGSPADPSTVEGWDPGSAAAFGAVNDHLRAGRESFAPTVQTLTEEASFAVHALDPISAAPSDISELAPTLPLPLVQLLAEPTALQHVTVTEGEWPKDPASPDAPLQIALTESAAATMGWDVGVQRAEFVLTATVQANDPDADRWGHLPTALVATVFDDGNQRPTATSVAWVTPESWRLWWDSGLGGRGQMTAWYPVDGRAALFVEPDVLLSGLRAATSESMPLDSDGYLRTRFSTELVAVMTTAATRASSTSSILAVAAVGPFAVTVGLIALAASLIARRRSGDVMILTARGAPMARVRRMFGVEGAILGVPAAAVGIVVALAVSPFDAGPWAIIGSAAVSVAPIAALAMSAHARGTGRSDAHVPRRSWSRTVGMALAWILAIAAMVVLFQRGPGSTTDSIDPLVIVAPLLLTIAIALVMVRLHPLPLAVLHAWARRQRGAVGLVGSARALRDSPASTAAVMAMVVAVSVAVFSSLILATVERGSAVSAQRVVGGDIRMAGPVFSAHALERIAAIDGVDDVTGIMEGTYVSLSGSAPSNSAVVFVTDPAALSRIQDGMFGALPRVEPAAEGAAMMAARALGDDITAVNGQAVQMTASIDALLGMPGITEFVVMSPDVYEPLTGVGYFPRVAVIGLEPGADPRAVAQEASRAVPEAHTTRVLAVSVAEITSSPAVAALRAVLLAAVGVSIGLAVVAVLLVAGVSGDSRGRLIAHLRTMGLDRRGVRGVIAWDFVPLGATAIVGGTLLGVSLPALVLAAIDVRPFTGGRAQPALTLDPLLTGILLIAVVVALIVAVFVGMRTARATSLASALRSEED